MSGDWLQIRFPGQMKRLAMVPGVFDARKDPEVAVGITHNPLLRLLVGKKRSQKPKIRPGAVLLKYFRDIASADLNALFPDVKVVMGFRDRLMLGVSALVGGIPILLKLA